MRLLLFAYFIVEVLAFIGVSQLIGIGWTILAVFALSVVGGFIASATLRNSVARTASGPGSLDSLGRLAGDSAILMVGWALCIIPGFVSSLAGLLLVFPPTRALIRRSLTAKTTASMEQFGMKVYTSSPMAQHRTSYGSFTQASESSADVIDADELEKWYREDSARDEDRPNGGEH
ncbi:FxsA family protein [Corynebacterium sp.]|uniref:FxsA family protein n=1 Tax=Corynebacterium sp. TaxID=1720 RepID=UPI002A90E914|nr:FxsA family protein [Corynebacterium sp.]MDY5784659.1 FxsA family protein [Corynebacterium sp.]